VVSLGFLVCSLGLSWYNYGEFEMKVFLSHSHLDKDLAGQVKVELAYYGLEVFLAHEDIEPLAEWIDVIFAELKACDVFIPILTENFDRSDWTDQETGIAYVGEKLIIPLKVAVDPHGFIASIQALRLHVGNVKAACKRVARVIASKPGFGDLFRDALIRKFGGSGSYDGAGDNIRLLLSFEGYTSSQVRDMARFTIANGQINRSGSAYRKLLEFVRKYEGLIEPELYRAFREAIGAPINEQRDARF